MRLPEHMPDRLKAVRDIREPDCGDILHVRARGIELLTEASLRTACGSGSRFHIVSFGDPRFRSRWRVRGRDCHLLR